jgi:pimeloyl-ACP methyl ester carboxylesterase
LLNDFPEWNSTFAGPIQQSRDIVFFDQRGGGLSGPTLDCPEVGDAFRAALSEELTLAEEEQLVLEADLSCQARLRSQGIDLDAQNSAQRARDLTALMAALGYKEWNVFGISYGTFVAMTALLNEEPGIRSVVLDSVAPPPPVAQPLDLTVLAEATLDELFAACRADSACNSAYPDLEEEFYALIDRLNDAPISVEVEFQGSPNRIVLNGNRFLRSFVDFSFDFTPLIATIPFALSTVIAGDEMFLPEFARMVLAEEASVARGVLVNFECNELWPSYDEEAVADEHAPFRAQLMPFVGRSFLGGPGSGPCEELAGSEVSAGEGPIDQSVPALILSGQFDPGNTSGDAERMADAFGNPYLFVFPGTGHSVLYAWPECAVALIATFLENPTAEPDGACVAAIPPTTWVVP